MSKKYKIDFYQLGLTATPQVPSPVEGFRLFLDGGIDTSYRDSTYTRELFGLGERNGGSWVGVLRKFRTEDLPEVARLGGEPEDINLEEGEGLVERNCFVFYPGHNLIGWQVDTHGSSPSRFRNFLSHLWGTRVSLDPVIQPDAVDRLMSGSIEMKEIDISVARPQNPDFFPNDEFSSSVLEMLNSAEAHSIRLHLGVDLRRDRRGRLSNLLKYGLRGLSGAGATTAKAEVFDADGVQHTIDLIADRVSSVQETDTDGRVVPNTLYSLIDVAKQECQAVLDEYFGTNDEALA